MTSLSITSQRLRLVALTPESIDALLAADGDRLSRLTGARFHAPIAPPPLTEETLPFVRDRLRVSPKERGWWTWLVVRRETGEALGAVSFGGPPDGDGAVVMGYATYPACEHHGYATEAARRLLEWALDQPGVRRVCSIIPPANTPAINVARKIGMRPAGTIWEEELDEVLLFAVDAP